MIYKCVDCGYESNYRSLVCLVCDSLEGKVRDLIVPLLGGIQDFTEVEYVHAGTNACIGLRYQGTLFILTIEES